MHILIVSLDYPPTVGGISAHVFEPCQALVGLGHETTVLTKKLLFAHLCLLGWVPLTSGLD